MKKEIFQNIEIPDGVETNIEDNTINIKGPVGENRRSFNRNKLVFEIKDKKIIIGSKNATKKEKKMINTIASHIRNLIQGVQEKFEYKLKVCFTHFPISVEIADREAVIKNFLGEKIPRKVKLLENTEVKIDGGIITINSLDKEKAGQTAANFEAATKIRRKDQRVFQDGIYITNKPGREM